MKLSKFIFIILFSLNSQLELNADEVILNNTKKEEIFKIHIVKKGETLSSISKLYSIEKKVLLKNNDLKNENFIFVGQNLKIFNENSIISNDTYSKKNEYHIVKEGESLTDISIKYKLDLESLIKINDIKNADSIKVGRKLRLQDDIKQKENNIMSPTSSNVKVYGPILIKSFKTELKNGRNIFYAANNRGQDLILSINCKRKEIDVRREGRKWQGWLPASKEFENNLIKDFCLSLN